MQITSLITHMCGACNILQSSFRQHMRETHIRVKHRQKKPYMLKIIVFGLSDRAKMQWSLFLLILMGQCSFFTCRHYEYHFIGENKTWKEAQSFCRENYTDLAKVYDMTDMKRLLDSVKNQTEAWIGLYSEPGNKRMWHWSLPGVEYNESEAKWENRDLNDEHRKNCVRMKIRDQKWKTSKCHEEKQFVCYNESSSDKFCFKMEKKNWTEAQRFCREHHTDLVSGDQLEDDKLKQEIADRDEFWIGLFRDTWTCSDGSNFSFRHWDQEPFRDGQGEKNCTFVKTSGEWDTDQCMTKKPFFCYKEKLILIQEHKTWDEALDYCREHHRDLVSITNVHQQRWVQQRAKNASSPFVWLGLRYTCVLDLWFWVNDHLVCYDNWGPGQEPDACFHSAAMASDGQWVKKADTEKYDFICAV